jgi:exopolysaccharide biosynthesis polyprenyl glycosylphosphotransferase
MLTKDRQMRMYVHQLVDACIFAISFQAAYDLRDNLAVSRFFHLDQVEPFDRFVWIYLLLIPAGPLILEAQGYYSRPFNAARRVALWQLFKGCAIATLGLILALFVEKMLIARWVVVWFGMISFVLLTVKEELLQWASRSELALRQNLRRFIFVGVHEEASRMKSELQEKSQGGVAIVGELDLTKNSASRLVEMLHEYSVNGVIISARHAAFEEVERAIRACELEGVEVWLVAEFFKTVLARTSLDDFYGRPVMVFRATPEASWQSVGKQVVDFLGALVLLAIFSPVFTAVAIGVKLTSKGPILFRQMRSGLNGQPFTIYKFRTMVTNAEQLKDELEALNEMKGPVFKISKDPRVTPLGRILRRWSIDEFPQLFNVLRGEMSLVGPRPLPVDEVKRFDDVAQRRRLSVKPGLTCLWQVSGRSDLVDFEEWVRLDLEYIDNWSLWLDLKILARTIPIVLTGAGAR